MSGTGSLLKSLPGRVLLCLSLFSVFGTISLFSQKTPAKDGGIGKLLKDFDNWYVDMDSQLTVRMYMTKEGWNNLHTVDIPLDPALGVEQFGNFGSFDPWFYFTVEYKFKPLRFMTLTFYANLMPENQNRIYGFSAGTYAESTSSWGYKNAYQDFQGEVSFDIGPGDMTLTARYYNREDSINRVLGRNGYTSFSRSLSPGSYGWPYDPNYTGFDNELRASQQTFRSQKLVMSLKNQKNLKIEPSITVTGQYLEVIMPNATNRNYDLWTFNNTPDSGYGRPMEAWLVNKLTFSIDGKVTFRPVETTLTIVLGGTISPLYPAEQTSYIAADSPDAVIYPNITSTKTAYLNVDLRLSPRVLWQSGFKITTRENRFNMPEATKRWLDLYESAGWQSPYYSADRDIWATEFFTGFQYK